MMPQFGFWRREELKIPKFEEITEQRRIRRSRFGEYLKCCESIDDHDRSLLQNRAPAHVTNQFLVNAKLSHGCPQASRHINRTGMPCLISLSISSIS